MPNPSLLAYVCRSGAVLSLSVIIGCASLSRNGAALRTGMSREEVIATVGDPIRNQIHGNEERLDYGVEGDVYLRGGHLSHYDLSGVAPLAYTVDAIRSGERIDPKVVILPGLKGVARDDLQFREFSAYVKRALQEKGYEVIENADRATIGVMLLYGISDPQVSVQSYTVPVYGMVSGGSTTTYNSTTNANASVDHYGSHGTYLGNSTGSGTANTQTVATSGPEYGVVGSRTQEVVNTSYTRYLVLEAMDLTHYRKTKRVKQVWRTVMTSNGSSNDLRYLFPLLVMASIDYIDANTGQKIEWSVSETDPRMNSIMSDSNRAPAAATKQP